MRLLAFVDIHGDAKALNEIVRKSQNVDILVCAGDLSDWGANLDKFISVLEKAKKPLLIIHGNHEIEEDLQKVALKFENVKIIHEKILEIDKFTFFGYGGGGFSLVDREFESAWKAKKESLINKKVILVTHAPPYKTALDKLNSHYAGCKSIRTFIELMQPVLHICGHLHENAGTSDTIGKTKIINPGFGRIIEIK